MFFRCQLSYLLIHSINDYCARQIHLRETGCPTEAPCIRSLRRFTRRLVVFSPITKLIASIKLDLPVKQQNNGIIVKRNNILHCQTIKFL